jgi:hypothetical protein
VQNMSNEKAMIVTDGAGLIGRAFNGKKIVVDDGWSL